MLIDLLYAVAVLAVVFWLLGFFLHVGGGLIHFLLVLAAIAVLLRVIAGKRIL